MNNWKRIDGFEFKARDFQKVYGPGQGGPKDDLYLDFATPGTEIGAIALAKHANDLLRERLSPLLTELEALRALRSEVEKAPQVSGYIHADGYILMDRPGNKFIENTYPSKPYTARLIYIKPIKEEPSK